jgi:hypothetical protein
LRGSDIGERPSRDDARCREFFAYKDGMPVKVVCPTHNGEIPN